MRFENKNDFLIFLANFCQSTEAQSESSDCDGNKRMPELYQGMNSKTTNKMYLQRCQTL